MLKRFGSGILTLLLILTMAPEVSLGNTLPQVTVSVDKPNVSVGGQFTLTVGVAGGLDVYGSATDVVYDPTMLELVQSTPGGLVAAGAPSGKYYPATFNTDLETGKRHTALALRLGDISGANGDGTIGTFTFKALKAGTVNFGLTNGSVNVQMVTSMGANVQFSVGGDVSVAILDQVDPNATTLKLLPSMTSVGQNKTFAVNVVLSKAQNVAGLDVKLSFPANLLQVVDQDPDTDGIQVAGGTVFPLPGTNTADNTSGTVWFAAARSTGYSNAGDVTVATVTFSTTNATGTAPIGFTETVVKDPATAVVTHNVVGTSVFVLAGGTIHGQVQLQGRSANSLAGALVKVVGKEKSTTTAADGSFSLYGVPAGTYQLLIRFPNQPGATPPYAVYLSKTIDNVVVTDGEDTPLAAVELRGGDANGDNIVELSDLILLAVSYGKDSHTGMDYRVDFNGDGMAELSDLIILATNYGTSGATVPPGE